MLLMLSRKPATGFLLATPPWNEPSVLLIQSFESVTRWSCR
jgi:hypothetical protein